MAFRLHVDPDRCQGHAACVDEAPEEFAFDDDTAKAHALGGPFPVDRRVELDAVTRLCPTAAITLVDEEDPHEH